MGGEEDEHGGIGMQTMLGLGGLIATILVVAFVRLRGRDEEYEPAIRS
jgi:hypothetical protein